MTAKKDNARDKPPNILCTQPPKNLFGVEGETTSLQNLNTARALAVLNGYIHETEYCDIYLYQQNAYESRATAEIRVRSMGNLFGNNALISGAWSRLSGLDRSFAWDHQPHQDIAHLPQPAPPLPYPARPTSLARRLETQFLRSSLEILPDHTTEEARSFHACFQTLSTVGYLIVFNRHSTLPGYSEPQHIQNVLQQQLTRPHAGAPKDQSHQGRQGYPRGKKGGLKADSKSTPAVRLVVTEIAAALQLDNMNTGSSKPSAPTTAFPPFEAAKPVKGTGSSDIQLQMKDIAQAVGSSSSSNLGRFSLFTSTEKPATPAVTSSATSAATPGVVFSGTSAGFFGTLSTPAPRTIRAQSSTVTSAGPVATAGVLGGPGVSIPATSIFNFPTASSANSPTGFLPIPDATNNVISKPLVPKPSIHNGVIGRPGFQTSTSPSFVDLMRPHFVKLNKKLRAENAKVRATGFSKQVEIEDDFMNDFLKSFEKKLREEARGKDPLYFDRRTAYWVETLTKWAKTDAPLFLEWRWFLHEHLNCRRPEQPRFGPDFEQKKKNITDEFKRLASILDTQMRQLVPSQFKEYYLSSAWIKTWASRTEESCRIFPGRPYEQEVEKQRLSMIKWIKEDAPNFHNWRLSLHRVLKQCPEPKVEPDLPVSTENGEHANTPTDGESACHKSTANTQISKESKGFINDLISNGSGESNVVEDDEEDAGDEHGDDTDSDGEENDDEDWISDEPQEHYRPLLREALLTGNRLLRESGLSPHCVVPDRYTESFLSDITKKLREHASNDDQYINLAGNMLEYMENSFPSVKTGCDAWIKFNIDILNHEGKVPEPESNNIADMDIMQHDHEGGHEDQKKIFEIHEFVTETDRPQPKNQNIAPTTAESKVVSSTETIGKLVTSPFRNGPKLEPPVFAPSRQIPVKTHPKNCGPATETGKPLTIFGKLEKGNKIASIASLFDIPNSAPTSKKFGNSSQDMDKKKTWPTSNGKVSYSSIFDTPQAMTFLPSNIFSHLIPDKDKKDSQEDSQDHWEGNSTDDEMSETHSQGEGENGNEEEVLQKVDAPGDTQGKDNTEAKNVANVPDDKDRGSPFRPASAPLSQPPTQDNADIPKENEPLAIAGEIRDSHVTKSATLVEHQSLKVEGFSTGNMSLPPTKDKVDVLEKKELVGSADKIRDSAPTTTPATLVEQQTPKVEGSSVSSDSTLSLLLTQDNADVSKESEPVTITGQIRDSDPARKFSIVVKQQTLKAEDSSVNSINNRECISSPAQSKMAKLKADIDALLKLGEAKAEIPSKVQDTLSGVDSHEGQTVPNLLSELEVSIGEILEARGEKATAKLTDAENRNQPPLAENSKPFTEKKAEKAKKEEPAIKNAKSATNKTPEPARATLWKPSLVEGKSAQNKRAQTPKRNSRNFALGNSNSAKNVKVENGKLSLAHQSGDPDKFWAQVSKDLVLILTNCEVATKITQELAQQLLELLKFEWAWSTWRMTGLPKCLQTAADIILCRVRHLLRHDLWLDEHHVDSIHAKTQVLDALYGAHVPSLGCLDDSTDESAQSQAGVNARRESLASYLAELQQLVGMIGLSKVKEDLNEYIGKMHLEASTRMSDMAGRLELEWNPIDMNITPGHSYT
ncbi:hypothetical protein BCR34DRAFT_650250 [Clohesyomyces aquaticus]|uniref:Uncharacterized protein n=1 Tax=Clohesyomyces aquaticus TaxID=1231657 RepID=A0A1Y1ZRJ5_9PLEO|nr:hypothetical protein BCR34DRAFT_650250 [Clohesyomyces aquaticus]